MTEVAAKHRSGDDYLKDSPPGTFAYWTDQQGAKSGMHFTCPCGCGKIFGAHFGKWSWDGNEEQPTLTPSLNCGPDHWHGFLTAGVFKKC